jgi:hypothetical protein
MYLNRFVVGKLIASRILVTVNSSEHDLAGGLWQFEMISCFQRVGMYFQH